MESIPKDVLCRLLVENIHSLRDILSICSLNKAWREFRDFPWILGDEPIFLSTKFFSVYTKIKDIGKALVIVRSHEADEFLLKDKKINHLPEVHLLIVCPDGYSYGHMNELVVSLFQVKNLRIEEIYNSLLAKIIQTYIPDNALIFNRAYLEGSEDISLYIHEKLKINNVREFFKGRIRCLDLMTTLRIVDQYPHMARLIPNVSMITFRLSDLISRNLDWPYSSKDTAKNRCIYALRKLEPLINARKLHNFEGFCFEKQYSGRLYDCFFGRPDEEGESLARVLSISDSIRKSIGFCHDLKKIKYLDILFSIEGATLNKNLNLQRYHILKGFPSKEELMWIESKRLEGVEIYLY